MRSDAEEPHPIGNDFFQKHLEAYVAAVGELYNHRRYHANLDDHNPADVYFGRRQTIRLER